MYTLIDDFLQLCIKQCKIPMDYVKSPEFAALLMESNVSKSPCYEVLCYSRNKELQITRDRSEARYFNENSGLFSSDNLRDLTLKANIDVDLSDGYKNFRVLSRSSLTLDNVRGTKYVALEDFERNENTKVDGNIVTSRHTLLELLNLPFQRNTIIQNVVAFNGQVFMEAEQRPQRRVDASSMTGYNFEEVMTCAQHELGSSRPFEFIPPLNNAVKYNSIVNHTFPESGTSVLVSCEIDSIKRSPEEIQSLYSKTEFKYRILENNIEMKSRRIGAQSNLIKAVLQCYLAGTNDLVVGYRDDNFNLKYVTKRNVSDILDSSNNPLLNRAFLDKWFWFIVQFISKSTKMPRNLNLHHHQLTFNKSDNEIQLKSFRLNSYRLEKTILNRFVQWRRHISTKDKNPLSVKGATGPLAKNQKNETKKRKQKKNSKKPQDKKFKDESRDHELKISNSNGQEQDETKIIARTLERISL